MTPAYPITLQEAFLPRATPVVKWILVLGSAGLVALAAQVSIPLPFTPVPITGQTFAVLLVGASLGSIMGATSLLFYLVIGLMGAPIYADGSAGLAVLASASGGYLIGFVVAAGVTGWLAERHWDRTISSAIGAMLCGNVLIYLCGLPWLAYKLGTGLERTLELGLYPFVVGDLLKLYLAAVVLPLGWRISRRHYKASEQNDSVSAS
jgi:biotin transport system substrate-specific component